MEMNLPWIEKYRPKKLDDVVGQEEVVERLKVYAEKKEMPSILFSGRAGIGKTACSIALAHEMYGEDYKRNLLELNASDERGIDVIRDKIKDYASTLPYGDVSFKIIFLDEADSLTKDAQNALRRTMEKHSSTCRFILSCNYPSKIIEPIQSRCALFKLSPLTEEDIRTRLEHVAEEEDLEITEDGYETLTYVSEGDMRKAINLLQVSATLTDNISEETVYKVASKARPEEVKEMIEKAVEGEFIEARKKLQDLLYDYNLSGEDIIKQVFQETMKMDIEEEKKVKIAEEIGEVDFRISEGATDRVQLEALLALLSRLKE